MLRLLENIAKIASFKAYDAVEARHAIDLIELKIRESEQNLTAAKSTLAGLIVRQRSEEKALMRISNQIRDLEERAQTALADGKENLALEAAQAIADLENEKATRSGSLEALSDRIEKIRLSIEKSHRRLIDLRQGAMAAKATAAQHKAQRGLERSLGNTSTFREAEELIARVTGQADPFEEADILDEIDDSLAGKNTRDKLAEAGLGSPVKSRADDVLERLKAKDKKSK